MTIPSLEFSYFNPTTQSYYTLKTKPYVLTVSKSDSTFTLPTQLAQSDDYKKDIELEKKDIRYIQEIYPKSAFARRRYILMLSLGITNVILTSLLMLVYLLRFRSEKMYKNVALKRKVMATATAEKAMKKLPKLMKGQDAEKEASFYEEVGKIMTQYLSDKFNLSTLGITQKDLEFKLIESLGSQDLLYQNILGLYETCEAARFARVTTNRADKDKALKVLKEMIHRFERMRNL
jgi:hypothetical protein